MRPMRHYVTTHEQGKVVRAAAPTFALPTARPMREPGTGYLTYITAGGPVRTRG